MYKSGQAYELEQSLRFNNDDSAYLSKTFASAGNRKTWTWSSWVKRTGAGGYLFFAYSGQNDSDYGGITLSGNGTIALNAWDNPVATSVPKYRDPSAWYHYVVAVDTTQATQADRVKFYANGVQLTPTIGGAYPSQNGNLSINAATGHSIGSENPYSNGSFLDDYLAEVNFIDGQQLTPADFGETGDYGEWKPIKYSGTYGTNGFYLPFKQDYTVEGFSTVTYKGTGADQYIGGTGFQPDLTWIKRRNVAGNHTLFDSVRGATTWLSPNTTSVDDTSSYTDGSAFYPDGFNPSDAGSTNASGSTYVGWNWDMGADTPTGFGCVVYKGNGGTQSVSGYGFSPDLVWIKCRSDAAGNRLTDTVRGATKTLESNGTDAENTQTAGLTAFEPDGFRLGDWNNVNGSSRTFVAWGWDMGNTTVTNTSGTISSQVRANPTYGQSIVTYTGTGSNATIGHGLSSAPEVVIVKDRSNANSWQVFHTSLGNTAAAFLDLTAAADTGETSYWNNTSPTNSLVTLGTNTKVNHSGHTYVAYAFHSVSGYSKFGSYTGNASTTGPSVTLGFRPAFLMVKKSSDTGSWLMVDATRNPLGLTTLRINADSSNAEDSSADNNVEFTNTGFQIKTSSGGWNASGQSFIYMAFAGGMNSISDYNTDGSIDSRVKANTTYGQSIVSYEGNFTA